MSPVPVAEREKLALRNNQLVLVVGQIRFPKLPSFAEDGYTVRFEEFMRELYPKAITESGVNLIVTNQGLEEQKGPKQLRFTSIDDRFSVILTAEFIALECRRYDTDSADFASRFAAILSEAQKCFAVKHQLRIGLRYVNEFRHRNRTSYAAWREWLSPEFVGWDPASLTGEVINTVAEFALKRENGIFVLRRGFLTGTTVLPLQLVPPREPAQFYLFDMDYFDASTQLYEADPTARFNSYSAFMEDVLKKAVSEDMLAWLQQ